jgi:SWI/SNF-related matrix-associated actin-dependent regulator of chromatin subfamily A3
VDKARVTLAMSLRRIDPADIPESARVKKPILASNHVSTSNAPKKRKAAQAGLGQASSSTNPAPTTSASASASASFPCPTQEDTEEDIVDELYCNLTTSVVGIQYYKGRNFFISSENLKAYAHIW